MLVIQVLDDGIGFDSTNQSTKKGIGLSNMQNRGKLIDADIKLTSEKGEGTAIVLTYYYKKENALIIDHKVV